MKQPQQFRKKPVVIHAVEWDGNLTSLEPLWPHTNVTAVTQELLSPDLIIPTLEGEMRAKVGDWIICGVAGELYPCKPDIFEQTYEPASFELAGELQAGSDGLLAALREAISGIDWDYLVDADHDSHRQQRHLDILKQLEAAIARAEGRQP